MADETIIQEISQEIEGLNELLNPQGDLISRENMIGELRQMYNEARKWYDDAPQLSEAKARAESCMATLIEMKLRVERMSSAKGMEMSKNCYDCPLGDECLETECSALREDEQKWRAE